MRLETQHINVDILFVFRVNRLFALIYLNGNNDVKDLMAKNIIYQKVLSKRTTLSSMEKLL